METNENLTEKLKYIGLDLENLPEKMNFFQNINFRMHKNYNEKNYKVYKYVDVNDIDIFIVPTHRLADYTEKYAKALPIGEYLSTNTDEEIERNIEFLNLIKSLRISEIEDIEHQQIKLSKEIPYNVQYYKDYLWQIYYDESSKKYYTLMPIKETECSALFYIIKKQLENKKTDIFVPICYASYSNKYWSNDEFEEMEKYIAYFTKEWPLIFEVHNKAGEMKIEIVGKTKIFDSITSEYKIELNNQGEAENFYKLIKALFILETQLSNHYRFELKLDRKGSLHFYRNNKEIDYIALVDFIKEEYVNGLEQNIKAKENRINFEKELKHLKNIAKHLDEEYYEKEKQISTFLECKKTFFGRVRYFFKYKRTTSKAESKPITDKVEKSKWRYCERTEIKDAYTIDELLSLYSNLDKELSIVRDFEADIEAMKKRINILEIKLKNAKKYINEIDEHKKSIFEFWKFTNKDDAKQLNEGIEKKPTSKKMKNVFNYDLDFEDLSKQFDKIQREIFSKDEIDNIYIATTDILNDLNSAINNEEIPEEHLDNLKTRFETEKENSFDIFGDSSDKNIKTLGNIRHRETKKNISNILNIKHNTTTEEYKDILKNVAENIGKCLEKGQSIIEMPVYKVGVLEDGFNVFYINPENALKNVTDKETNIYKLQLKEKTNCLAFTNIMYYNNTNQTLPLGMNVTDGILIDTRKTNIQTEKKGQKYRITLNDKSKPIPLKLDIYECHIVG